MTGLVRSCREDMRRLFNTQPEAPALVDAQSDTQLSYADLDALTARAAALLLDRGATPERPVVAVLPNAIDTLVLFLGARTVLKRPTFFAHRVPGLFEFGVGLGLHWLFYAAVFWQAKSWYFLPAVFALAIGAGVGAQVIDSILAGRR